MVTYKYISNRNNASNYADYAVKPTLFSLGSCVEDEDKGLALGTLTVFISLFGLIPSPIMLGAVIGD